MVVINCTVEELVFAEKPISNGFQDLTGNIYHRLTVLGYAGKHKNRTAWFCICECKTIKKAPGSDLKTGLIKSCGCYKSEQSRKNATKHGKRFSDEYKIYLAIKNRCTNPKTLCYPRYGGKGVQLKLTFEEFFNEIGIRPSKSHSVDRIDGNRHYETGNIRWATMTEQGNNKSNNHRFTYLGKSMTLAEWAKETKLSYTLLKKRRYRNWCEHHTLTLPSGSLKPKDCANCRNQEFTMASKTTF